MEKRKYRKLYSNTDISGQPVDNTYITFPKAVFVSVFESIGMWKI
jgi:hypothetical protein